MHKVSPIAWSPMNGIAALKIIAIEISTIRTIACDGRV